MITLEVIDYGVLAEYGFFGKTVCKSDVRGMTDKQIVAEKHNLLMLFPGHAIIEVFEVGAIQ